MDNKQKHQHHLIPFKTYYLIWLGLIIGTIVTVATSYIDFGGSNNILIAMLIASVKALLVVLFFMGLKYEGYENNVTFFCTFVFLAIFVSLTGADLFYRRDTTPVVVDASEAQAIAAPVDVDKLHVATPELVAKGQQVFAQQCITCHGAQGKGDGPAAAALNPKPRNFTVGEGWKNGRSVTQIFKTLTEGLPGTPMPAFVGLSGEDRFALAHYVRTITPDKPEDSADAIANLKKALGGPGKPRLSVNRALDKMAEEWERDHKARQ